MIARKSVMIVYDRKTRSQIFENAERNQQTITIGTMRAKCKRAQLPIFLIQKLIKPADLWLFLQVFNGFSVLFSHNQSIAHQQPVI